MSSSYCNTPYSLNLKLKNLNNYTLTKNVDINKLYNDLNNSIPSITNNLCFLKKTTRELNKSLNGIPVIHRNCHTNRENYKYYSSIQKTLPNISSSYYTYSYASPKPVLKQYKNSIINHHNNNLLFYKYGKNYSNINLNHKNKLNYDSIINNPINLYLNRNYSKINTNINKYKHNNNLNKLCVSSKNNVNINNINRFNKSCDFNNYFLYKRQLKKFKEQLGEKDKIINKMRDLINDTLEQLNLKNKENSLLQSELSELKSKKIFKMKNNYPINNKKNNNNENKKYNNNYQKENAKKIINYENKRYNNNLQECAKKKKNKKNNNLNSQKNNNRNTYNKFDKKNLGNNWEEIRKLNKKMENLLLQNENNLEKYEEIRRKYNEY